MASHDDISTDTTVAGGRDNAKYSSHRLGVVVCDVRKTCQEILTERVR